MAGVVDDDGKGLRLHRTALSSRGSGRSGGAAGRKAAVTAIARAAAVSDSSRDSRFLLRIMRRKE